MRGGGGERWWWREVEVNGALTNGGQWLIDPVRWWAAVVRGGGGERWWREVVVNGSPIIFTNPTRNVVGGWLSQ